MRAPSRKIRKLVSTVNGDATPHYLTLRGGRMTKVAGVAASFAPTLGSLGTSASVIALAAALTFGGTAEAQTVTNETLNNVADPNGNDVGFIFDNPGPNNTLNVTTTPGSGVDSRNVGTAVTLNNGSDAINFIDSYGGNFTGTNGFFGNNQGTNLSIDVTGTVLGTDGDGINIYGGFASNGTIDVTVQNEEGSASTTGALGDGVLVQNYGNSAVNVTVDRAQGLNNNGVSVRQYGSGDLFVDVISAEGNSNGIVVIANQNNEAQRVEAFTTDQVQVIGQPVFPVQGESDITITATESVIGNGSSGVFAKNETGGDTTVDVTNEDGDAETYGRDRGIYASNTNGGDVSVSANNVSSRSREAIFASNTRNNGNINVNTAFATSVFPQDAWIGDTPILDGGTIDVQTTGLVQSQYGTGIRTYNSAGGDTTVDTTNEEGTGQVTGYTYGITSDQYYGGNLNIFVDNVTGQYRDGIRARNNGNEQQICCLQVMVTTSETRDYVNEDPIYQDPFLVAEGDITITATGLVSGGMSIFEETEGEEPKERRRGGDGIDARNTTGGSIFITSANEDGTAVVEGAQNGILARAYQFDERRVRSTQEIGPMLPFGFGTSQIDITAQTVSGEYGSGIAAYNYGSGLLIGRGTESEEPTSEGSGINITVTNSVSGGQGLPPRDEYFGEMHSGGFIGPILREGGYANGITAVQIGLGDINIDATNPEGTVEVTGRYNGIFAENLLGDINIDVDNATGQYQAGVRAITTGFLEGPIFQPNLASASVVQEEMEEVEFDPFRSDINISSTGTIVGGANLTSDLLQRDEVFTFFVDQGPDGISATNLTSGDITVTSSNPEGTASVTGHRSGISTFNISGGDTTITANDVEGKYFHGVYSINLPYFNLVEVVQLDTPTLATIEEEPRERKIPEGDITITVSGVANGGQYAGLAEREDDDVSEPRRTEAEEGSEYRDNFLYNRALQYGGAGIFALNGFVGDVTVNVINEDGTAASNGVLYGVAVGNFYGGNTSITVDNANGGEGSGVAVYHDEYSGDISVSTNGTVEGGQNGIWTQTEGDGDIDITVAGKTTGEEDTGIKTVGLAGTQTTITLKDGADVSGGEFAITNDEGDSTTTLEGGSKLSGNTSLGDGNDDMTIQGDADISEVAELDGGDDKSSDDGFVDVLTFSNFTGTVEAGTSLENWEEAFFEGGDTTLALSMIDIPEVTLKDNAQVSLTDEEFTLKGELKVLDTSTFNVGVGGMGNVMFMGDVQNDGTISLINGNAGDMLTITGHFSGNGDLGFDVDFAGGTNDRVDVDGDLSGEKGVEVNALGTASSPSEFTLVQADGDNTESNFALSNPNTVTNDGEDALANGAFLYTLDHRPTSGSYVLTPFDAGGNIQFNPTTTVFEALPGIFTSLGGLDNFLSRFQGQGGSTGGEGVGQALLDFSTKEDQTFYARITGSTSDRDLTSILRTNVDTDTTELSMGFDIPMYQGSTGTLFGGFNFAYLNADSSLSSIAGLGSIDTEAFGYTFSAFYLTDGGFYVDGRYRFTYYDSSAVVTTGLGALGLTAEGTANSASLEVGKLIGLSNGMTLIPQFQIQQVDVSSDPLVDPLTGIPAGFVTDGETMTGRLGLWLERDTARKTVFGSVSVFHDFDGSTTTNFGGFPLTSKREETRLELGVGGEFAVGQNSTVFGRVFATGGLGDWTADETYSATAGFRMNF